MAIEQALVSIITPTFCSEKTIRKTIRSVREQTYPHWELIIIDDASTDRTRELLREAAEKDSRIKLLFLQENRGAAFARNRALELAQGRYIAFLDSDDCWKTKKIEEQLRFMEMHHYAFTFTGYELMDADGHLLNKLIAAPSRVTYKRMLKNTIVGCLTVMIDRQQIGDFRMPDLRSRQDLATWLSLLKKGTVAYGLNETLAEYRISGKESLSGNKWRAAKKTWFVYRRVEHLPLLASCWYFVNYATNAFIKRFISI
ncbi:teichuronic acid biosynthesis protein TuaG [Sporolactobacillus nakayamae]|uniref:Teichuronic acid biosynthesis glycosyltransferase TuaG n=1 Tax=Sporolactobacillus nakayamae TaxID=269670 RepID=A0A1I2SW73_9BACL|nr:glycosyltransferase family 2 protein [Sporolactobacillus nakayamae]SFG56853.1 teichuronic acid biosynthesis glycosyltransferase TuaG [Sporolactobacillus nakayamae]